MHREKLIDVANLEAALAQFAAERNWQGYHTPRNLMLALVGEVGELAECLQWKSDEEIAAISVDADDFIHLQEEVADVLLYLVRLSSVLGIDLNSAVVDKLLKNGRKYPPGRE